MLLPVEESPGVSADRPPWLLRALALTNLLILTCLALLIGGGACASRLRGCAGSPSLIRGEGRWQQLAARPVRRSARGRTYWGYASRGR